MTVKVNVSVTNSVRFIRSILFSAICIYYEKYDILIKIYIMIF